MSDEERLPNAGPPIPPAELEYLRVEQERRRVYCPDGVKHPALMASSEPHRGVCPRCYADVPVLPRLVKPSEVGRPVEEPG